MRAKARKTEPTTPLQIVIFGGTGDLAKRKLIPALLDLYTKKKLPKQFVIFGLARSPFTDDEYRVFVQSSIDAHNHKHAPEEVAGFCKHLAYIQGSFNEHTTYTTLAEKLHTNDMTGKVCASKLFYLAIPPELYGNAFKMIHAHKLHMLCDGVQNFSRILVEKPFGRDLHTAQKLDALLSKLFSEEQIFRIDHYLAKEAVQNILSFRFANTLIRGAWNRNHIDHIRIYMHEAVDADNRAAFYDDIGAVRDVGQNHLLQLYALLAMEEPKEFTPDAIRAARARAIAQVQRFSRGDIRQFFIRGQYQGYKKAKGVRKGSDTETFFQLKLESKDKKLQGVPFYVSSGKALHEARVTVQIFFREVAEGMFPTTTCELTNNCIELVISPDQSTHITLNAKTPGLGFEVENRVLSFTCAHENEVKNSYERVLLDCIRGDQTLFTSTDEVLASWRVMESVLLRKNEVPLQTYKKGSGGPKKLLIETK